MRQFGLLLVVIGATIRLSTSVGAASNDIDAVAQVVALFETHDVVALGEGDHGNEQGHEFRLRLVRDPRFRATVNDIVIEFGNAKYQALVDRYVAGESVPLAELRAAWRDTSQASAVWDAPIYEDFIRAVRDANAATPASPRLRLLLGDPPIDWTTVTSFADIAQQMRVAGDRDTHPARVIAQEVRAKRRKALVIYGDVHLQRMPAAIRPPCQAASPAPCYPGSVVDQLERDGAHVFNIHTLTGADADVVRRLAAVPAPRMIALGADAIGELPYRAFNAAIPATLGPDGQPQPEPPIRALPLRQIFDGLLWIGGPDTITYSRVPAATCADPGYVEMRGRRMALVAPPGAPAPTVCGR